MLVSGQRLAGCRGVPCTDDDRTRSDIIESLLCGAVVDLSWLPDWKSCREPLEMFTQKGLAVLDGARLQVTHDGLPYARTIASLFDRYRATLQAQFSNAV
jgi:oxygen-independent coproporphyrinogen-3 oxidase